MGRDEGFASWFKETMPELDARSCIKGFQEVALGYGDERRQWKPNAACSVICGCIWAEIRFSRKTGLLSTKKSINPLPATEGVFQLLDTDNLHEELLTALEDNDHAAGFEYEEDKMYSQRESELIQRYLQEHGEMPGGGEDGLDDLF